MIDNHLVELIEKTCPSCGEQCDITESACPSCGHIFWESLSCTYEVRAALEHLESADSPHDYWMGARLLVNAVNNVLEGNLDYV